MLQGRFNGSAVEKPVELERDEAARPHLHVVSGIEEPRLYQRLLKPAVDRVIGVILAILTLPIVVAAVLMIWAKLGRPAIFKQERVGLNGRPFTVYKLRTMRPDRRGTVVSFAGKDRRLNHKSPDDPRHVPLGRFLRKWSIDELPQFWNVALGHMSLVGPRPELPHIVAKYEQWQHRRHAVKPGITGLWQVSERGEKPMHEATDVDIEYVDSLSMRGDIRLLLLTIPAAMGAQKGH